MKLNKLLFLLLALPLVFAACKKSAEPSNDGTYLYNVNMAKAERVREISAEGITFEDNQFMLLLTDSQESCELGLLIQGEQNETTLATGNYNSARGAVVLDNCYFAVKDGERYSFNDGEGSVVVTLNENRYNIDATFTDVNGNAFHFTYNGVVTYMSQSDKYFIDESMRSAERLLPEEKNEISKGDIGFIFIDSNNSYVLAMVLTLEQGKDILTAGTYSTELGNIKVDEGFYVSVDGKTLYRHVSAEVKVEFDSETEVYNFDMLFTDAEGRLFHFTYEGVIKKMITTFEDAELTAWCFGHYYGPTYNYYIWMGKNIMADNALNKHRFIIDLYGAKGEKDSEGYYKIPNGTYKLDTKDSMNEGTFSINGSCYEFGPSTEIYFKEGTLVVTDDGATLTVKDSEDVVYTVKYNGEFKAIEDDESFKE